MPEDFDLQPFDPAKHGGFVYGDFLRALRTHWPWAAIPAWRLRDRLVRELARPGTVACVVTPKGMGAKLIGFIAARPRERVIVWACTRYHYRRMGVATSAAEALGIDFAPGGTPAPVGLVFWTYAAARIVARGRGFFLFHDTREIDDDAFAQSGVPGRRPRTAWYDQGDQSE